MARVSRSSSALRRIDGADPYLEIGGITEVAAALPDCPALLFDRIKGYPKGLRMLTNATTNVQRAALALGIDPTLGPLDALKAWMEVRGSLSFASPRKSIMRTSSKIPMLVTPSISPSFRYRIGT